MQPLSGVRVLDLSRLLPGPWATMLLADLGAEVIKVEHPDGGDGSRAAHPRFEGNGDSESVYFCSVNRNKRSITLDLTLPGDSAHFLELARGANAVIENFRPGGAERLGIGYARLRAANPSLVYCAISGYGQTGSLAHLPGHDLNVAGMSGFLQADADRDPAIPRFLMADYAAATLATVAVLSALYDQKARGRGAYIDVAMLDALMSQANVQLVESFARAAGATSPRRLEGWGGNPRYGLYRTRDGRHLTVSLLEKRYWAAFCRLLGREDLINEEESEGDRLSTHGEHGGRYRAFLEEAFAGRDRDEWVALLQPEGIPVGPVLTLDEMYSADFASERSRFLRYPDPRFGRDIPQPGFPFQMRMSDGADAFAVRSAAPRLGEGNPELLPEPPTGRA